MRYPKYALIAAVLVVLGGGVLLFATGGDEDSDQTAGSTLTETARGGGAKIVLNSGQSTPEPEKTGGDAPAAPQVSDDAITSGRRATVENAGTAPRADAPIASAALQEDETIERRPLGAAQDDADIERQPLAPGTPDEPAAETEAEAPKVVAAEVPAEPETEAPKEITAGAASEAPKEVVADAAKVVVAEAPAEPVADAPKVVVAEASAETPREVVADAAKEVAAEASVEAPKIVAEASKEVAVEAPVEPVTDTPKEVAGEAPAEPVAVDSKEVVADAAKVVVADSPKKVVADVPAEPVAEAPRVVVAESPAETPKEAVAAAPVQIAAVEERAGVVEADGSDTSVRLIKSRRLGAPTQTVTAQALPGVRGIKALKTAARLERLASEAGGAAAGQTETGRTVVAALSPRASANSVSARGAGGVGPTFDVVRISASGNAVIAGRAEPGAQVVVLDRGTALGQVKANRRGEWVLVPLNPLPPGATEIYIEAALPGVSPRQSENVVVVLVPERDVSPAVRAKTLVVLTPRGGGPTRIFQGSRAPVARDKGGPGVSLDVVDYDDAGNIILSGRADADAEIRVYTDNRLIGTARSDEAGDWQLQPDVRIAPGDHELRVDSVSPGGKVLARSVLPFTRADLQGFDLRDARVVVQPGNSLWRIARATYGSGRQFTLIYNANRDQIVDPDLIFPGQVFRVPETN